MAAPGLCHEEGASQPGATGSASDTLLPWIPVSLVLGERTCSSDSRPAANGDIGT